MGTDGVGREGSERERWRLGENKRDSLKTSDQSVRGDGYNVQAKEHAGKKYILHNSKVASI